MAFGAKLAALQKFQHAINSRTFDLFDEVVHVASVDHDPAPGQVPGAQGYKDLFRLLTDSFPDLRFTVDRLVSEDNDIAVAYTITGTQSGYFLGHVPTGWTIAVSGVQIMRFQDGLLMERWGSNDFLGILQQLGLAPVP